MVVVATQGHGDEEAVEQAVAARPAYLGLVGSRQRGASVLGYLAERGVAKDQLDRVRVPAGLDLGKTTHVEIAVAVLAELVQLRAAGELAARPRQDAGASRSATRPARGVASDRQPDHRSGLRRLVAEPAEATDPVCGMTVAAGKAGRPLEFDGVTYYFCSAGCRSEFQSDPDSYARKETRC